MVLHIHTWLYVKIRDDGLPGQVRHRCLQPWLLAKWLYTWTGSAYIAASGTLQRGLWSLASVEAASYTSLRQGLVPPLTARCIDASVVIPASHESAPDLLASLALKVGLVTWL